MAWIYLICAGICEVLFVTMMKVSNNFTRPLPIIIIAISIAVSFVFLGKAMRDIPVGTAYAIWVAIGVIGSVIVGTIFFKEQLTQWQALFMATLIFSIVGLKMSSV